MGVARELGGLVEEVREGFGEEMTALRRDIHREPEFGFHVGRRSAAAAPPTYCSAL